MWARKQINFAQHEAGRYLESLFERAAIDKLKALDFSREPVDQSRRVSDPYSDHKRRAYDDLARARAVLGDDSFKLLDLALSVRPRTS